jgi:dienelactone hydrolase
MQLVVEPQSGRVDTVPRVLVGGVRGPVRLEVATTDAAGHRWESSGTYPVGADGALVFDDAERPWWDMTFADAGAVPVAFTAPDTELRYEVRVSADGAPPGTAVADVRRRWGPGGGAEDVRGDGFVLQIYRPNGAPGEAPSVVVVPGSTGVSAMAPAAALLASHGYVAAVLGYMQEPGLPSTFRQIPIEAILAGLRAFAALPGVDPTRVGVLAVSVGTAAVLAALSGSDGPPVGGVVVVSPTHVVWQAQAEGPPPKASMLTRDGRDLPYVRIRAERLIGQILRTQLARRFSRRPRSAALELLPAFRAGLSAADAVGNAAIPVERIAAPMLAVAGEADAMWPSAAMARALLDRRREQGGTSHDRLLLLPDAGHFLRAPVTPTTVDRNESLVSGGTPEGTARGQRTAWDAMLRFFTETIP